MSAQAVDPFELFRFVEAQCSAYADALEELKAGQKRTHWMWFIFPQVAGLGNSSMAKRYAIGSRAEGKAFLEHPLLGDRLRACVDALLAVKVRSAEQVMGDPDFMKLQSSMTLFAELTPAGSCFERLLDKYYGGRKDPKTLNFLAGNRSKSERATLIVGANGWTDFPRGRPLLFHQAFWQER
jgi:uncharacterized protein (DUF1810 family)